MEDPYDLDLPDGWDANRHEDRVSYVDPADHHRIDLVTARQGLRLHFRIEIHDAAGDLERIDGPYMDEANAADAVETLIHESVETAEPDTAT